MSTGCVDGATFDAVIVGAGPAGCTTALNLAPLRRVLVVDRRAAPEVRIGECLAPAAARLLGDMGLLEAFERQGHRICHCSRSVWGSFEPLESDSLRDLDGHGWHIDRQRFEAWLRRVARDRGASLLAGARVRHVRREGRSWVLRVEREGSVGELRAATVVDATGRAAAVSRHVGSDRVRSDDLVCVWARGRELGPPRAPGLSHVEAVADGWWYTAALPGGARVLAFHTDLDLPGARADVDAAALAERARVESDHLREVLSSSVFTSAVPSRCAASSARTRPCAGPGWCAAGDAALAFDPLASQGLHHALFTGLASAMALDACLEGDESAMPQYAAAIDRVRTAYESHRRSWYAMERRWPDEVFWKRRHAPP